MLNQEAIEGWLEIMESKTVSESSRPIEVIV
jgi:hypothetical protein